MRRAICLAISVACWVLAPTGVAGAVAKAGHIEIAELMQRAEAARSSGDRAAEFDRWADVLSRDAAHPRAHERLAEMTGPAARRGLRDAQARIERAYAHPYDPWALLRAAQALLERGDREAAVERLEKAVWVADIDPAAALDALVLLREIEPSWLARRVVPVHIHADEAFRDNPGWRFQLRTLWLTASNSLDGVLSTRFVPIAIGHVDLADVPNDLDAMHAAFVARVRPPQEGVLAAVTGRPVPSGTGVFKKGFAEFLGRDLIVRIDADTLQSRVLAHEILHLYGAIHVLDDVESLMNPTSTSLKLDAVSLRVAQSMLRRTFLAGGIEKNILRVVDLRAATDAYIDALSLNLSIRDDGIKELRYGVMSLDPHLADASRLVAALMVADGRAAEALHLLELAAKLYGPDTERGLLAAADAAQLRFNIGVPASNSD